MSDDQTSDLAPSCLPPLESRGEYGLGDSGKDNCC